MATVEIDLAHVLSTYSAVLKQPSKTLVRDIRELPFPKEVIKMVLKHCIKLTESGTERDFFRAAYVCLADFQNLSDDEKAALSGSEPGGPIVKALHERHAAEAAALLEEMKAPGVTAK
jgi:hypothetical protein